MTELPDEFDSKREFDAFLSRVVYGWSDIHTIERSGKLHWKGSPYGWEDKNWEVPELHDNIEKSIEMLGMFMNDNLALDWNMSGSGIEIEKQIHINSSRTIVSEGFEQLNKIDPFAISVAIYRAYQEVNSE